MPRENPTGLDDPESRKKIVHRLRRARGQLDAVIAAVEEGKDCRAVLTQLSAASSAIERAGFLVVATAMRDCVEDPESELSLPELEKLFLMLA